jgi:hypothetical protein
MTVSVSLSCRITNIKVIWRKEVWLVENPSNFRPWWPGLSEFWKFIVNRFEKKCFYMVRTEFLTTTSMKMAVVWDAAPCSLVDIDLRSSASKKTAIFIFLPYWLMCSEFIRRFLNCIRHLASIGKVIINYKLWRMWHCSWPISNYCVTICLENGQFYFEWQVSVQKIIQCYLWWE